MNKNNEEIKQIDEFSIYFFYYFTYLNVYLSKTVRPR